MPGHERQLILNLFTGNSDDDDVVRSGFLALHQKATDGNRQSSGVDIRENQTETSTKLMEGLKLLDKSSRLYISGHGDWRGSEVGGWKGKPLADYLARHMDTDTCPGLISIIGCSAARAKNTNYLDDDVGGLLEEHSVGCFAQEFHYQLHYYKLKPIVYARMYDVVVLAKDIVGKVRNLSSQANWGRKTTALESDNKYFQPPLVAKKVNSKLKFYWKGGDQMREFVNYTKPESLFVTKNGYWEPFR